MHRDDVQICFDPLLDAMARGEPPSGAKKKWVACDISCDKPLFNI
jgi:hypothetical protein